MIGARGLRCEQKKNKIDRFVVDGIEGDALREADKQAVEMVELGKLAVRDGYAVADPVVPRCSRSNNTSKIERSGWPVSFAARTASS